MAGSSTIQVICDAGPLIHLDELGCLDLLADFDTVIVPEAVWQEVTQHRPEALTRETIQLARVSVMLSKQTGFITLLRSFSLDTGEQEALALMRQQPGAMFLTDDAAARLVAEQIGMPVHSTVGVLLRAIRRDLRTPEQVLSLLSSLPQKSTLYIRQGLLNTVIAHLRQEFDLD